MKEMNEKAVKNQTVKDIFKLIDEQSPEDSEILSEFNRFLDDLLNPHTT